VPLLVPVPHRTSAVRVPRRALVRFSGVPPSMALVLGACSQLLGRLPHRNHRRTRRRHTACTAHHPFRRCHLRARRRNTCSSTRYQRIRCHLRARRRNTACTALYQRNRCHSLLRRSSPMIFPAFSSPKMWRSPTPIVHLLPASTRSWNKRGGWRRWKKRGGCRSQKSQQGHPHFPPRHTPPRHQHHQPPAVPLCRNMSKQRSQS
jgi:hypothetical protein